MYGGLIVAARLLRDDAHARMAGKVRDFVLDRGVVDGSLIKFVGTSWVDASLVHAATPYRMFEPHDPIMRSTIERLERELLVPNGGIHRYVEDNYYGGGEWILLAAYLGAHYVERGELERARQIQRWIESKAANNLDLPEQVADHLLKPDRLEGWIAQWGKPASPLLWSHASYLTLVHHLERASNPSGDLK